MKIIILGKRDQMGTTPNIRVKGMSRIAYNFLWDPEIKHYAYPPKNQKEVDDIFRTQGKLYRHIHFSVWLDPVVEEVKPEPAKKKGRPKKKLAAVV